jgi:hypothetical protein
MMQAVSVLDSLLIALSPGLEYLAVATQDGRLRAFETGEAQGRCSKRTLPWVPQSGCQCNIAWPCDRFDA